jgi:hypothetical protein
MSRFSSPERRKTWTFSFAFTPRWSIPEAMRVRTQQRSSPEAVLGLKSHGRLKSLAWESKPIPSMGAGVMTPLPLDELPSNPWQSRSLIFPHNVNI